MRTNGNEIFAASHTALLDVIREQPPVILVILILKGRSMESLVSCHVEIVITSFSVDDVTNLVADIATLSPGAVNESVHLGRVGLAGEPESLDVGAHVLVLLESHANRPVAVRTECPAANWNLLLGKHELENLEHLLLGLLVSLTLHAPGLLSSNSGEEDVGALSKALGVERLEKRVSATLDGISVKKELGLVIPERLVELHENLGVGAHGKLVNGALLPCGKSRLEINNIVLEHADGERADGIVGLDAATVLVGDLNTLLVVVDALDSGAETEPLVVLAKELIGFLLIAASNTVDKAALIRCPGRFEIPTPPVRSLGVHVVLLRSPSSCAESGTSRSILQVVDYDTTGFSSSLLVSGIVFVDLVAPIRLALVIESLVFVVIGTAADVVIVLNDHEVFDARSCEVLSSCDTGSTGSENGNLGLGARSMLLIVSG
ncbi:hypothetical protein HG531_001028 [Fusarium graminearum]|nr:hypothetical protein HG531_001028 [Fusarium graminearum]